MGRLKLMFPPVRRGISRPKLEENDFACVPSRLDWVAASEVLNLVVFENEGSKAAFAWIIFSDEILGERRVVLRSRLCSMA